MEEALSLLILGTLAAKIVEFIKYLHVRDWNAAITQISVWVAGCFVVFVAAQANTFEALVIPGMSETLGALNFWALMLLGLTLTSFISFTYDFKKALDGADSAKQPPLTSL